jgi:hypothetical protein
MASQVIGMLSSMFGAGPAGGGAAAGSKGAGKCPFPVGEVNTFQCAFKETS